MKSYLSILISLLLTFVLFLNWKRVPLETQVQPETMELVPMMRLLLSDVYTIDEGLYTENYSLIEKGAAGIAGHPGMTMEDRELIKNSLGREFKKFVEFDMTVHHHADSMAQAARQKNMEEVMRHFSIVREGCLDCHKNFRTDIMNARQ